MPIYINASDLILSTSLWEGSPNVIKEAMACNKPILSTNVGDISRLFKEVSGCDIIDNNPKNISKKIKYFINNYEESNGLKRSYHWV